MATLTRGFEMGDRYRYDFKRCTLKDGWAQLDSKQDASYYGQWANPLTLELQSYCEGDTTRTTCDCEADFIAELTKCVEWNKEAGYWIGIDAGFNQPVIDAFTRMGFGDLLH